MVGNLAARGEATLLWGAPGVGKSLLVEACCGGVGHGETVAGMRCKRGRVLYLDAENGEYEVHRRVHNLGLPADSVVIYDASTTRVQQNAKNIRAAIKWEAPDLLVLDSLRRMTVGMDENESGAMATVVALTKEWATDFDLATLLIHHARKDGRAERGSSAIKDQVSISWEMCRESNVVDRNLRRLVNHEMRIAAEPADRWLRIEWEDGLRIVDSDEPEDDELATGPRGEMKQQIVDALEGKRGTRSAIAKAIRCDSKHGTFRRALQDLETTGFISRNGDDKYGKVPVPRVPNPPVGTLAPGTQTNGATTGASGESVAPRRTRGQS